MPLSDHNLTSREPLPIPEGEWQDWAARLIAVLDSEFVTMTQAAAILPIIDSSGRTIIDLDGVYAYDALGGIPISPDIVEIDTQQLVDAAVITIKLANLAVETTKLANLAVGTAQMALLAVTSAIIGNLAVVTGKIDNLSVNEAKLANLAVTSAKIALLAIDRAQIANTLESDNWNNTTKTGIHINFVTGAIQGQAIIIYKSDGSGDVLFSSSGTDFLQLNNLPADASNMWYDPLFALGSDVWLSNDALHNIVADPLGTPIYNNVLKMDADGTNNDSSIFVVAAKEGDILFVDFDILKGDTVDVGADAGVYIRWNDKDGASLGTSIHFPDESGMSISAYTRFASGLGPAPAGTVAGRITISNRASHDVGSFYLTNLRVGRFEKITSDNISTFIANVAIQTAQIANLAVTNAEIANLTVTNAQIANLTIATGKVIDDAITKQSIAENGGAIGPINFSGTPWTDIVSISFTKDEDSSGIAITSVVRAFQNTTFGVGRIRVLRDSTDLKQVRLPFLSSDDVQRSLELVDSPSAGTYTYKVQIIRDSGTGTVNMLAGDGTLKVQEFKK